MKNYVSSGRVVPLTAPYQRNSGQGMLVGNIFGVAATTTASGAECSASVTGVFDISKDASTFVQGDKVYWDNTAKACTSTTTSNKYIGVAMQAQVTGDANVRVRLHGIPT